MTTDKQTLADALVRLWQQENEPNSEGDASFAGFLFDVAQKAPVDTEQDDGALVELFVVLADLLFDSQGGFFEEALLAVRSAWAEFHDGNV